MLSQRSFLIAGLLLLLSLQTRGANAVPPGEPHVYKQVDGRSLSLYVTKPLDWKASDQRPAIVFYHGGGWVGGAPGQFTEHSAYLASRGMVAVQVQYRLLNKKGSEPPVTCVADAKSAMRWVRGRATELGIDPERIASAGGSAGGHLAAFVGMVDGGDTSEDDKTISAKSNAMVLFNAVFDNGPGGWGNKRVGERYKEFSPFHNASRDDPPAIVFLGSKDALIPVKTADDFKANMMKVGVDCEVMIFEGQGHGFFNHGRSENKYYNATVIAMDKFLASLGWLEGSPTLVLP
ncbi:MAG: alpha/beta hydrolase [Planctomycetes bacterium]|nr:alpha/beta hydrolase [Planctomycetota bacterium]